MYSCLNLHLPVLEQAWVAGLRVDQVLSVGNMQWSLLSVRRGSGGYVRYIQKDLADVHQSVPRYILVIGG